MPSKKDSARPPFFERIHSFAKFLICIVIAIIIYFFVEIKHIDELTHIMISWDAFSFCMIIMSWITFFDTTSQQIRTQAKVQDSSRTLIFSIILISTFASFLAVLLLIVTKKTGSSETLHLPFAIGGMLFSWILIHTVFALRYAHIYYGDHETKPDTHAGGLDFPGDSKPDYLDFAYFSFVLGMTFQVSDVQVTAKRLRRLVMLHGLLSFGYDTIMIALTINVIAGFGT